MDATDAVRKDRSHLWAGALLFALALLCSAWFVAFVADSGERIERERMQSLARTAAATLESANIAALAGSPADVGKPAFDAIRAELRRTRDVNPDFRFVYLMRPAPGGKAMAFLADAESPESPDYSAPGDVYDGPDAELWQSFRSGQAQVQPPYQDRWGNWVTAIAPVRNAGGKVIAILGMDVNAAAWQATQARYRGFALAICALVLVLIALATFVVHLQKRTAARLALLNAQLERQLRELEAAQEGLRLADTVVRHTGEGVLVLDPELRVVSANPGFVRMTGHDVEGALGKTPPLFDDDKDALQQVRTRLHAGSHWEGTLWARRADGDRFPLDASVDRVLDAHGKVQHFVMVFRDVTEQKLLEDRLRELSATDGLTLLANRRSFDESLERAWHHATRHGEPVSLIMIDIDHFKAYNDLYGHGGGDRCLQQVATAIAEGLRRRVESLGIAHAGNPTGSRVTISVGISTRTPPQTADFVDLMHSADQALYKAKEGGRNGVVTSG